MRKVGAVILTGSAIAMMPPMGENARYGTNLHMLSHWVHPGFYAGRSDPNYITHQDTEVYVVRSPELESGDLMDKGLCKEGFATGKVIAVVMGNVCRTCQHVDVIIVHPSELYGEGQLLAHSHENYTKWCTPSDFFNGMFQFPAQYQHLQHKV